MAAAFPRHRVVGIDLAEGMVEMARQLVDSQGLGTRVEVRRVAGMGQASRQRRPACRAQLAPAGCMTTTRRQHSPAASQGGRCLPAGRPGAAGWRAVGVWPAAGGWVRGCHAAETVPLTAGRQRLSRQGPLLPCRCRSRPKFWPAGPGPYIQVSVVGLAWAGT